jgi:hypothetical protein
MTVSRVDLKLRGKTRDFDLTLRCPLTGSGHKRWSLAPTFTCRSYVGHQEVSCVEFILSDKAGAYHRRRRAENGFSGNRRLDKEI